MTERKTGQRKTGQCMCGSVRYSFEPDSLRGIWDCPCVRCRRWTGHHMAASNCGTDEITFESDDTLNWYRPEEYPTVAYGFCTRCGSSLFWKKDVAPDRVSVCAGAVDPPTGLSTVHVVHLEDASDYFTPPVPESDGTIKSSDRTS